jgi:hypothetical protein
MENINTIQHNNLNTKAFNFYYNLNNLTHLPIRDSLFNQRLTKS